MVNFIKLSLIFVLVNCSGEFSGTSAFKQGSSGNQGDQYPTGGDPNNSGGDGQNPNGGNGQDPNSGGNGNGGVGVGSGAGYQACTATPEYNPQVISCAHPLNHLNWSSAQGWSQGIDNFLSSGGPTTARWISPIANCGDPLTDMLISVSHFKIEQDGDVVINTLNDNKGTVRIWKDADPSKSVFSEVTKDRMNNKYVVKLEKGFYSIVADTSNFHVVSAIVLSVSQSGKVLRETKADDNWCIFRTSANTDVSQFIRANASCRKCLTGVQQ